jgi:uncharacterized coiled-coil DUF342 family protein
MAATLKTLLEKTTEVHKIVANEDNVVGSAYDAVIDKISDLRKKRDGLNEQLDVLEDVQYAIECRDEYDLKEALERLQKIA